MGVLIGGIIVFILAGFCIWCILRVSSYESRIEEQYRIKKALDKLTKKKKGKK